MKVTSGAVFFKNDKMLLGLRRMSKKLYPGFWDIVGGHVEDGETLEQALIREVMEEIGVKVTKYKKLGYFKQKRPKYTHHIYSVTAWRGRIRNMGEFQRLRWFTKGEIKRIKIGFGLKKFLLDSVK